MEARTLEQILAYTQAEVVSRGAFGLVFDHISTDSRTVEASHVFLALRGEKYNGHDFIDEALQKGVQACIIDRAFYQSGGMHRYRGRSVWFLVLEDSLEAYQRIAHAYIQEFQLIKIAITGSNGKSTTKEILKAILSQKFRVRATEGNLNNQIGVPKTLLEVSSEDQVLIVEMGAGKRGDIARLSRILLPDYAIVTNISPAHSEFLGDLDDIAYEKRGIFQGFHEQSLAILHQDEAYFQFLKFSAQCPPDYSLQYRAFSLKKPLFVLLEDRALDGYLLGFGKEKCRFPLLGQHNLLNLHFALLVARELDLQIQELICGIEALRPLEMRMQCVRQGEYSFLVDCYNANPASVAMGLEFLARLPRLPSAQHFCVLGDMCELGEKSLFLHEEIGAFLASLYKRAADKQNAAGGQEDLQVSAPDYLFTLGKYARVIAMAAVKNGFPDSHVASFQDYDSLVRKLKTLARKEDLIYIKASRTLHFEQVLQYFSSEIE